MPRGIQRVLFSICLHMNRKAHLARNCYVKLSYKIWQNVANFFWQNLKFTEKIAKSRFVSPFGRLGVTYTVHLWLVEKRVVDFLLVLIELFSPALTVEALWADIGRKRALHFERKFQGEGAVVNQRLSASENQSPWSITCCLRDPTFNRFGTIPACDTQTDTRWWLLPTQS